MTRTELVSAVAVSEDVRPRWCGTCNTSAGYEASIYAMVSSGLQPIGVFAGCDRCNADGGTIVCHYCRTPCTGGAEFWRHLRDTHNG